MSKEQLIGRLLAATTDELRKIELVFAGKTESADTGDRRLLTLMDAAKVMGLSRMTIHRMAADGRLPVVETRAGRRRIPSAALTALLTGKEVAK